MFNYFLNIYVHLRIARDLKKYWLSRKALDGSPIVHSVDIKEIDCKENKIKMAIVLPGTINKVMIEGKIIL